MILATKCVRIAISVLITASITCFGALALHVAENNTTGGINLRASAETGDVLTQIPSGARLGVLDDSKDWYEVVFDGKTGYVLGDLLTPAEDGAANTGTAFVNCEDVVNFRKLPNMQSDVIGQLTRGTQVEPMGIIDGWYLVEINGKTGYIHPDYLVSTYTEPVASQVQTNNTSALLSFAQQFIGTPYVYGGRSPSGFDCSGFTSYVYEKAMGMTIPRTSGSQSRAYDKITDVSDLQAGDLVFFGGSSIGHVGIYVGNGEFLHSPQTGSVIRYDTLYSGSYSKSFQWGGRPLQNS